MSDKFIIGSRGSRLALWQSEWVQNKLLSINPQLKIKIEIIKTSGDVNTQQALTVIGGKGVFTKELEEALLDHKIDLAVHSLKDLPTILHKGLTLAAITEREDARDALIVRSDLKIEHPSIATLPQNAVIGTSSQRRMALLKSIRPDVKIKDLRGNLDTRLRKLDEGQYDAIVLASAGLRRLGWGERISAPLSIEEMLPAVGQGALGLETRADDEYATKLVLALNHESTDLACKAERAFLRGLGGGCQLPIAGHAIVKNEKIFLEGLLATASFDEIKRDKIEGPVTEAEKLGAELAATLLKT